MRKGFVVLILSLLCFTVFAEQTDTTAIDTTSFAYANVMYEKGQYDKSIAVYEQLIAANGPSATLYYNLGNCYFRKKMAGPCILAYERALLLDPDNDDIVYNLEIANRLTRDTVDAPPQSLFAIWWHDFITILTTSGWAWLSIILMWIAGIGWVAFVLPYFKSYQRIGFFSALLFFLFGLISLFGFFGRRSFDNNNAPLIVMSPSSVIKSEPSENSTNIALVHEGFKMQITDSDNNWFEVEMPDKTIGWIRATDCAVVDPFKQ